MSFKSSEHGAYSDEKAASAISTSDADTDAQDEEAERAVLFRYGSEDREEDRAVSEAPSSPLARGMLLDLSFATSKSGGRREEKDCIEEEQLPIQETDITGR